MTYPPGTLVSDYTQKNGTYLLLNDGTRASVSLNVSPGELARKMRKLLDATPDDQRAPAESD